MNRCQSSDALGLLIAQSPTRSSGMGISRPIVEPLAPEVRAPGAVQFVQIAVLFLEPLLEIGAALVAAAIGAADFIVDLPADDDGVFGIVLGLGADDAFGEPAKVLVGIAIVPPAAPHGPQAVAFISKRFGIFFREPGRHDRRGRADDHFDIVFLGQLQPAIEPVELVLPFLRLEQHPGKLGHADDVEARLLHHLEIGLPALLRPMLGIVVGADVDAAVFGKQILLLRGSLGETGRSNG